MEGILNDQTERGEADWLFALQSERLANSPENEGFERITRLAEQLFDVPTALVSLVTADRQRFRSRVGPDFIEADWNTAFCAFTVQEPSVLVVEDAALDDRFHRNRFVTGCPGIRFYAGAPLVSAAGHALGSLCVIDYRPRSFTPAQCRQLEDLARLVMAQIDLYQSAGRLHDVTRLPNRAQWAVDLEELALAGDTGQHTLVLVDIMNHARLQSALLAVGITAVEIALRHIAARLQEILDGRSPLYHVSDTRFAFVLRGRGTAGHAAAISQILMALARPIRVGDLAIELEVQCGAVTYESGEADASDVLRKATSAMHLAERRQLPFLMHQPVFDEVHRRSYAMLRALPIAMNGGELRLVYQPKLDFRSRRFNAVEALVRWRHPKWGDVSPAEFIPAIENTSTIHLLTEWVLHAALAQTAAWQAQGLFISMAVNVSARNLEHPNFVKIVGNACALHGIDPRHLHVECTENAVLTGERSFAALAELREMGAQISLDDFGIGYSNLACLQKLPVDLIKIDQSLVKPIVADARAWTLLQSLIALGHTLGYRVLAEGVETKGIYDLLSQTPCDAMQGYFLSRPVEAAEVLTFMREPKLPFQRHARQAADARLPEFSDRRQNTDHA
ncbi:hypothetical protein RD110_22460 [Rhodoferax koreense]|uniref:Sensor domain-containing phosphodiesterase n=1 Tax=Rhodoferax koreensis TaxID=1842727 RepID=A0A1P8K0V1_9BURK|nr:sensor domain-containing phosphodiesterase [Rhodoferax koreense]APW39628.1 hypothetical protein RD110_22460 [Rhodoferax koreense]